jgi:hypothetical protein
MKAYRTFVTVGDPQQVVLTDVPFQAGERVEVVLLGADPERAERLRELQALLRETQSLPQAQSISEDDILQEIDTARSGR